MSILVNYVDDILTPTENEKSFIKSKIRSIRNVLTQCSSLTPKEIHTGGSFEKGTMLSYKLDADLIYVYNRSEEVAKDWQKLVTKVYKTLKSNFPAFEVEEAGNLAIHLKTSLDDNPVNFDIVPCYYVNSPKIMEDHTDSNLYTGITSIWHARYLTRYKNYPFFTHVVRLLKDWKREHDIPLRSIHLELLTVDVYENVIDDINDIKNIQSVLMDCFVNILDTMDGYSVIPSNWKYCNEANYAEQYTFPVIIDPANPKDNLLSYLSDEKEKIKKIRKRTKITIENLENGYFADIFDRKGRKEYFD